MNINIRRHCLSLWNVIDPIYFKLTRLQYIEENGKRTIMRVRVTRYKGRAVTLSDGTVIDRNDMMLKIHLHNAKLLREVQAYNDIKRALIVYKSIKESLPLIASYIQSHDYANDIKGLIGITMVYRGSEKLGFETFIIHSFIYKFFKQIALLPIYFLASNRVLNKRDVKPMYLFMSKDQLFNKYVEIK